MKDKGKEKKKYEEKKKKGLGGKGINGMVFKGTSFSQGEQKNQEWRNNRGAKDGEYRHGRM